MAASRRSAVDSSYLLLFRSSASTSTVDLIPTGPLQNQWIEGWRAWSSLSRWAPGLAQDLGECYMYRFTSTDDIGSRYSVIVPREYRPSWSTR